MAIVSRKCVNCGRVRQHVESSRWDPETRCSVRVETNLDRDENVEDLSCIECGTLEAEAIIEAPRVTTPHGAGFPYFDVGLGVMVESEQHRLETARAMGLRPMDGEMEREVQKASDAMYAESRRLDEEMAQMHREYMQDESVRKILLRAEEAKTNAEKQAIYEGRA